MSYVDKNLTPGETVIYRAKLHWGVCIPPLFFGAICILLFFISGEAAIVGGLVLLFIVLPMGGSALVSTKTSEFAVTNKRVIIKVGFVSRKSLEVLLSKIEGISADQGVLGRMLNYGTIVIAGSGGTKTPFAKIADPLRFRREVQEQIEKVSVAAK